MSRTEKCSFTGRSPLICPGNISCKTGQNQIPTFIQSHNSSYGSGTVPSNSSVHIRIVYIDLIHISGDSSHISFPLDSIRSPVLSVCSIIHQICPASLSRNASHISVLPQGLNHYTICCAVFHDYTSRLAVCHSSNSSRMSL